MDKCEEKTAPLNSKKGLSYHGFQKEAFPFGTDWAFVGNGKKLA